MKILINAGHAYLGNPDPGAIGPTGLRECDVVASVGGLVQKFLIAAGVQADYIQDDSLEFICETANEGNYDLFLSIHCNSFNDKSRGIEVYTSRGWTNSDNFATCLMNQMANTFPSLDVRADWSDGDVDKEAGLYVLNNTAMPAALFELPFISNPVEEEWLRNPINQNEAAKALARGVTDYVVQYMS